MPCPRCQTVNPEGAKFCQNCGQALQRKCPNCGTMNAPEAKFCMNCGWNLAPTASPVAPAAPPTRPVDRFQQYIPKELLAKLEAARASRSMAGERRVVTVLFCDVEGSTALAERLDPEDWAEVMNSAFEFLIKPVYHYEGTVARLMGDAILAFFGAPIAHEDDPQRAVLAGLDIVQGVGAFRERLKGQRGLDFNVRVGINTGLVVVGEVGADLRVEYTAMGDAVNLASRLQSAARPMTVLVSEMTYRFIAPVFEVMDRGLLEVKGKAEPVHAYEVVAAKVQPGRVRGLAGLESPMVGRDAELAALLQLSEALRAGLGRVAVVVGEPGLGKSRLIAEWKAAVGAVGRPPLVQWAEGRCLSYGQSLAYHLLLDLLHSLLGVPAAASAPETHAALRRHTDELFGPGDLDTYPYLGHLLSLHLEGAALERVRLLDPQALQNQYLTALRRVLSALAARQPLVLVLDDIHWADPSSVDLLTKLLPIVSEGPLLFCFVTRPDRDAPGWKLVRAARELMGAGLTELTLNPLSEADSRQLVSNLLDIEALPENVRNLILMKAEGNPFFVEEVIRMLIDRGAIVKKGESWALEKETQAVDIPDNLQGLLLARIDRLPDDVKYTLRVASVIGRQFAVKVLEQVMGSA